MMLVVRLRPMHNRMRYQLADRLKPLDEKINQVKVELRETAAPRMRYSITIVRIERYNL